MWQSSQLVFFHFKLKIAKTRLHLEGHKNVQWLLVDKWFSGGCVNWPLLRYLLQSAQWQAGTLGKLRNIKRQSNLRLRNYAGYGQLWSGICPQNDLDLKRLIGGGRHMPQIYRCCVSDLTRSQPIFKSVLSCLLADKITVIGNEVCMCLSLSDLVWNKKNMSNFQPLKVVGRGGDVEMPSLYFSFPS